MPLYIAKSGDLDNCDKKKVISMIIIACRPLGRRLFVILTNPVTALLISRQDDDHRDDNGP